MHRESSDSDQRDCARNSATGAAHGLLRYADFACPGQPRSVRT
jgi:hypothetical protein